MSKVITYSAPRGDSISLARTQVSALERAGKWPRNSRGEEYCTVSHGLHTGPQSMTDEQIAQICAE